jgi:radical SAM superfamily enzyme YgiQ (UPF0313 family)
VKILLISTYELGRQPFGLASPAAWLRKRGHEVVVQDLSRDSINEDAVREARLIGIYLPMHTATRLASELIPRLRETNAEAHFCCYGLYAPMNAEYLGALGVKTILGGEFEAELARLAERLASEESRIGAQQEEQEISMARLNFEVPDRSGMPALEKYAHLVIPGDGYRIAGSTEASRGCKHLCRHCPIVPVYNGVFRIVSREVVLEDVKRQVKAGAQHISFGDPDFFNGIRHAAEVVEEFHQKFPDVTYDVTIKIEHLRKYKSYLPKLKETGCLFVISAVESVDDSVLGYLDKGHTRGDFLHVVGAFRKIGLTLHPTFVSFTPWTTLEGYIDQLNVVAENGLIENVAPIQLGIRLLIPKGSRILELEEVHRIVDEFDAKSLAYPWKNPDPRVDALGEKVQQIAVVGHQKAETRLETFGKIWAMAHKISGRIEPDLAEKAVGGTPVPFLSEPWYCCAEPTMDQLISIGGSKRKEKTMAAPVESYF